MEIRKAQPGDLEEMMRIYRAAKDYMDRSGNPNQWKKGYPTREMIKQDIEKGNSYVCAGEGGLYAAFAFIIGEDPTYRVIEQGAWKNDRPYGTIHRIAADGRVKGMFSMAFQYCRMQIPNLRADTHEDNKTMQHLLETHGFERCGIIYAANGTPRIAYQFTERSE